VQIDHVQHRTPNESTADQMQDIVIFGSFSVIFTPKIIYFGQIAGKVIEICARIPFFLRSGKSFEKVPHAAAVTH
jgi:hypothetical protein